MHVNSYCDASDFEHSHFHLALNSLWFAFSYLSMTQNIFIDLRKDILWHEYEKWQMEK